MVDGRRHKVTGRTKTEAKLKLRELRLNAETGLPLTPGDLTVATLLQQWEAKALPNRNLEPSTMVRHRSNVRTLTADLGRRRVRSLTPEIIEEILDLGAPTRRRR